MNVPFFVNSVFLDPDFSLLVDSKGSDDEDSDQTTCQKLKSKKSSGLSQWEIITISVTVSVGGAALIAGTVLFVRKTMIAKKNRKILMTRLEAAKGIN
eukprot:gene8567-10538_t